MEINETIRKYLSRIVHKAVNLDIEPSSVILEVPRLEGHGDIATNIAMKLSEQAGMPAMALAEKIVEHIQEGLIKTPLSGKIAKITVKQPGFINFFLTQNALYEVLREIQTKKDMFGSCNVDKGRRLNIEFVSANPTGPLSVAHGRQAAVGDSLANILQFTGWRVTREYFINDEGRQMDLLGESIRQRYLELLGQKSDFPQDGYKGKYIYDIARCVIDKYKDKFAKKKDAKDFFRIYGCGYIMEVIKKELFDFGARFDVWSSQAELTKSRAIDNVFEQLQKNGYLYKKDGALWFKSTAFGDDKDRVVIKSDGSYTYLAPDIAYHKNKYARGFERLINIWGPDHHGYIPRLSAAVRAMGFKRDSLRVIIVQLATLYRGTQVIPMSTRLGEFISLRQIKDEVGRDAARFFFVSRRTNSHLDFDIELAKKQSQENPVYYVQYAHARICSILDFAKDKVKGQTSTKKGKEKADEKLFSVLKGPEEVKLMKVLSHFPAVVISCADALDPSGIPPYLLKLAGSFHSFYDKHRVVTEDLELTSARLTLVDCVRIVLVNGLRLLGVCAPEKM